MLRPGNLQDGSIKKKKMKELKDFLKENKINGSGTQPQLIQVRFGTATARLRRQQSDAWNSRETHSRSAAHHALCQVARDADRGTGSNVLQSC